MKKIFYLTTLFLILLVMPLVDADEYDATKGPSVTVSYLGQDPDPAIPGEYVDLRWKVDNFGSLTVKDVSFELEQNFPFSLDNPGNSIRRIGDFTPYQTGDRGVFLHWRVKVDRNAAEGTNEIKLRYMTEGQEVVKLDAYDINIQSKEVLTNIQKIEVTPEKVKPGEKFNVKIYVENTALSSVENLRAFLDLDGTDFATIDSSSEKSISKLNPGENHQFSFNIIANPETKSKVYNVPLKLYYSDIYRNNYSKSISFGVPVYEAPFYTVDLEKSSSLDTDVYVTGNMGNIVISVSNTGIADLNFVTLELLEGEDYELLSNPKTYLGNLESDDYETAEWVIYAPETVTGKVLLKVKMTYRDSYNKVYEMDYELPLKVYSKKEAIEYGLVAADSKFGLIIVAIILIALGWYFYRKRKSNKKKE